MSRAFLTILVAGFALPLLAADQPEKIPVAVVDLQKAMFESVPGKAVVEEFNTYARKMQASIDEKQSQAAKLREDLKAKEKTLKPEEKEKLEKDSIALEAEAKRIEGDAQDHLSRLEASVIPQLQQEIDRVIREYAKERGIGLVIDQSSMRSQRGGVRPLNFIVINPAFDITDEIVKRLASFKVKPLAAVEVDPKDNDPAPRVILETTAGNIVIELNRAKAPITVANFLKYVDSKHYDGTVFHRVLKDFVIQGGGHVASLEEKPTGAPIRNEAANGLSNVRGSIAMARETDPDTATSQFYINVVDNSKKLDFAGPMKPGYCVFGKVIQGMDVVDKIRDSATGSVKGMQDVPLELTVIKSARRLPRDAK